MKKITSITLVTGILYLSSLTSFSQDLIHYWNFNDDASTSLLIEPSQTIGGAQINHIQVSGISEIFVGTAQNFDVENWNARNGDVAGSHLRLNDPIDDALEFIIPTIGYENPEVRFSTRRSAQGAAQQNWYYSIDGGLNYTFFTTITSVNGDPVLEILDFSVISATADNANFRIKVEFSQGAGGTSGNNRFDNFTVDASPYTGQPSPPNLTVLSSDLVLFEQMFGYPSLEQVFYVTGSNLIDDIEITSSSNFEISLVSGQDYSTSVTIPSPDGFVLNIPVYVRLNALAEGTYSGSATVSSLDATDVTVPLEGEAEILHYTILHYWHFNEFDPVDDVTHIDADYSHIFNITGILEYTDPIPGERDIDSYTPGSVLNVHMGENAGAAARVRNPSATRSLVFDVPTTGAENIVFTYSVQRSNNGMLSNTIQYSIDGIDFITTGLADNSQNIDDSETWVVMSYDFSLIEEVNDNPNFKIRIIWEDVNASNASGNNRYDNILLRGDLTGEASGMNEIQLNQINLHPNPSTDKLTISFTEPVEQIFIFNSVGSLVNHIEQQNSKVIELDVSKFDSGVYTLLIKSKSGYAQSKFIKK